MESNITQTKQKLKKAIELQKELDALQPECMHNVYDSNVNWKKKVSEDDISSFVDEKMEPTKPQEKEVKPLQKVSLKIKDIIAYAIVLAIGLVGIIVPLCYISVMGVGVVEIMIVGVVCFLVGIISLTKQLVALHKNKIVNDKIKLENEEIEKFNAEEYPQLLQAFEEKKEQLAKQFLVEANETNKKVYSLRQQVEDLDVLSFKYLPYAQDILDYLIDKRADSIKEAINLLVQEKDINNTPTTTIPNIAKDNSTTTQSSQPKAILENDKSVEEFLCGSGHTRYKMIRNELQRYQYFVKFVKKLIKARNLNLSVERVAMALCHLDQIELTDNLGYTKKADWCGYPNIFDRNKNKFVDFIYRLNHNLPPEIEPAIYNVIIALCVDYDVDFDDHSWLFDADFWQLPAAQCYEKFKEHLVASGMDLSSIKVVLYQDDTKSFKEIVNPS